MTVRLKATIKPMVTNTHMETRINSADLEYARLASIVLNKGRLKQNRTDTPCLSVFGAQARFNLQDGFPLLTTKKVHFKAIVHELLWFLSGSTNIKYLVDNDVHIWDEWAYKKYLDFPTIDNHSDCFLLEYEDDTGKTVYRKRDFKEFIEGIRQNQNFADKWGCLGEGTYGGMWRRFPLDFDYEAAAMQSVDQIQRVLDTLKNNPDDRRMIVSAWHPYWAYQCALAPCHMMFQFNTEELTKEERMKIARKENHIDADDNGMVVRLENGDFHKHLDGLLVPRRRLNCQLYQRSCDLFLGVPFNIASYSLLTHMIAQVVNMVPGEFIWTGGDVHLYQNSIIPVQEQISRVPKKLPKLELNSAINSLFDFKYEDIKIVGYDPHPAIRVEVAV